MHYLRVYLCKKSRKPRYQIWLYELHWLRSAPRRMIDNTLRKAASSFRFLQSSSVHRLLNGILCPWPRASCQCRSAIMVRLILDQANARRSCGRVRGSRIQAVARNTSNLEKNTPRLLLFLLAWRSVDEATTDAVVDRLRYWISQSNLTIRFCYWDMPIGSSLLTSRPCCLRRNLTYYSHTSAV